MACGVAQKCSEKYIRLLRLYLLPAPPILAALCYLMYRYFGLPPAIAAAALLAASIWAVISLPRIYYNALWYTRYRDWMKIERGILWRRIILIPRRRIQYVTMRRSLIEKLFGLCTLVFVTSGGREYLSGLTSQDAARMRALIEGVSESEGEGKTA